MCVVALQVNTPCGKEARSCILQLLLLSILQCKGACVCCCCFCIGLLLMLLCIEGGQTVAVHMTPS